VNARALPVEAKLSRNSNGNGNGTGTGEGWDGTMVLNLPKK
jgi:hypothetical protein